MGYSFWLAVGVLLYAPFHRQDSTYHGLCYTSCGALAGTLNSSMAKRFKSMMTSRASSRPKSTIRISVPFTVYHGWYLHQYITSAQRVCRWEVRFGPTWSINWSCHTQEVTSHFVGIHSLAKNIFGLCFFNDTIMGMIILLTTKQNKFAVKNIIINQQHAYCHWFKIWNRKS